ncbi:MULTISPECIES: N-acetyl sugar amidotransferase [unclassified Streptomyces]|uniref:N-acetyl sugar amidotransferase n=1 Tax=unclassified Streptomyces TaxID=2593676 RepID=UPI0033E6F996
MANEECTRCGLPDTRRSVNNDTDGVCSVCRHHELKNTVIDWDAREREFTALVEGIRGRHEYDAVVPFGGGKDGAFVLYHLVRERGLRCLAVTVDNRFMRQQAWQNLSTVLDELGVDQVTYRPPFPLVKRMMQAGFEAVGTVCWHCNASINAYPVRVAVQLGVPLVVHASSSAEYHSYPGRTYADSPDSDLADEDYQEVATGLSFDRMAKELKDVDRKDLEAFSYPGRDEIARAGVRPIFLSNYLKWDDKRQVEIIRRELGWGSTSQEGIPEGYEYEKFDCFLVGTRDYLRFIQEGYGRGARLGAIEARLGRLTRDEAIQLGKRSDGRRPASLDRVLRLLDVDEEVFLDGAVKQASSGREFDLELVKRGSALSDADHMPG